MFVCFSGPSGWRLSMNKVNGRITVKRWIDALFAFKRLTGCSISYWKPPGTGVISLDSHAAFEGSPRIPGCTQVKCEKSKRFSIIRAALAFHCPCDEYASHRYDGS